MKRILRNALHTAFQAPPPADRARFLRTLPLPRLTYRAFFFSQLRQIRLRVWLISVLLLCGALLLHQFRPAAFTLPDGGLWTLASVTPFAALAAAAELARSADCRMAELEMSCRYSLHQLLMARITILGISSVLVFTLLLLVATPTLSFGHLRLLLYLLTPYCASCGGSLLILNRMRSREGLYGCAALAGAVSLANALGHNLAQGFYADRTLPVWLLLCLGAITLTVRQTRYFVKQSEELQWN